MAKVLTYFHDHLGIDIFLMLIWSTFIDTYRLKICSAYNIEQHLLQTSMVSLNYHCWWIGKMMTVWKHGQGLLVCNNHARMVLLWYMFQLNHQYMRNISLVSWTLLQSNHWSSTKCSRYSWIACSTPVGLPICLTGLGCSGFHS